MVPAFHVVNTNISTFALVDVIVGATPLGHLTEAGQEIVLAVPSAVNAKVRPNAFPVVGILENVMLVIAAFNDTANTLPKAQFKANTPAEIAGAVCFSINPVIVGVVNAAEAARPVAFPVNEAVIVPAEKLPEASLCTTKEAVFSLAALIPIVPVPVIVPPVIGEVVAIEVTVPEPIAVLKSASVKAVTVLSALNLGNVIAEGFTKVNKFSPTVVAPKLDLPVEAVNPVEPPSHCK